MRELRLYTVCHLIVTENRCFDTAERIHIMKMNSVELQWLEHLQDHEN